MRDASGARTTKFQVDRILRFKAARPSDPDRKEVGGSRTEIAWRVE